MNVLVIFALLQVVVIAASLPEGKMIDYVKGFTAVDQSKILIKNPDEVNRKIKNLIDGGLQRLSIISDYDLTITKQHFEGVPQYHAFAILKNCPSVPPEVRKIVDELTNKFKNLDRNLNIYQTDRKTLMNEWWSKTIDAYKGLTISKTELTETALKLGPPARDNATILFKKLTEKNVPVLLVSAGLHELLSPLLIKLNITGPNIEMLVNHLKLDDCGRIDGYTAPPIHTENKNKVDYTNTNFFNRVRERNNLILMGDHISDATMSQSLSNIQNIIKIGFFYGEPDSALPTWLDTFDIVLNDDQTMNVPLAILDLLN